METSLRNLSLAKHPPKKSTTKQKDGVVPKTANGKLNVLGSFSTTGTVKFTGMIESPFIKAAREKFGLPPRTPRPWPSNDALRDPQKMLEEFNDAFLALFMLKEDFKDPPTGGKAGSAKKLIEDLVKATGWPDPEKIAVPAPWNSEDDIDMFRRYEIGCVVQILMEAYHKAGTGGGSTPFPPDH